MPGDFPTEQYILHLRSFANVVDDHVSPANRRFFVHNNADVVKAVSQVPGDQISRRVILSATRDRQNLPIAFEESCQVGNAPMGYVPVQRSRALGIGIEVVLHVFVNFLLQIDAKGAVNPNNFIAANARIWRDVSSRIRNSNISGIVADCMCCSFNRCSGEALQEFLLRIGLQRSALRKQGTEREQGESEN